MVARLLAGPTPAAFLYALLLWAMPGLVIVATKLHKSTRLAAGGFADVGSIVAQDVLLLGATAIFVLVVVVKRKQWGGRVLLALLHIALPMLACAAVFEHAFFLTTGSILDGGYAAHRLASVSQDLAVIRSEITFASGLALLAPFIWSAAIWWRFRSVEVNRDSSETDRSTSKRLKGAHWRGAMAAFAIAMLLGAAFFFVAPRASWRVAQPNFLVGFIRSAAGLDGTRSFSRRGGRARALPDGPSGLRALISQANTSEQSVRAKAKNAIVVVLESTGANRTSVYNKKLSTTPALLALAKRGAVVERAYTSVPHTTKALVSLNCGIYPKMSPGTEEAKFGAIPTSCAAKLLRQQGFATAYFQSAEENYERRKDLVGEFGYETFVGKESLDGTGFDEASYFGWEDDVLVAPVLAWVDAQRQADKRYYATLLTLTAHHPYAIPQGFAKTKFDDDRAKNDYLNAVLYVDRMLGKLVQGLDDRGALDDTIVIVVGDHGEGFGEHRRFQHDAVIYEEGIHIPMVVAGAGIAPGTRIAGLRQNIDVVPTLVEALGFAPVGGNFDGASLLSSKGHARVVVSCHYRNYCMAELTPTAKTIFHFEKGAPELFDIDNDPLERENLLGTKGGEDPNLRKKVDATIKSLLETRDRNNRRYDLRTRNRVERYVSKEAPDVANVPHFRALDIVIDDHTRLVGVAVTPEIEAGDQVEIITFYEVLKRPPAGLRTFHDINGPKRIRGDHVPLEGAYPVRKWKAGDFIEDRFVLSTRPDTLVGSYYIFTGLKRKKGKRTVARKAGVVVAKDGRVRLPNFRITKPKVDPRNFVFASRPAILDDTTALTPVDATFGDLLRVHAVGIDKAAIKGGLKTTLTYVFEVLRAPGDAKFFVDFDGPTKVKRLAHTPVSGTYPPRDWKVGEFVVDHHEIITHTRHRHGTYRVLLGLELSRTLVPVSANGRDVDDDRLHVGSYTLRD